MGKKILFVASTSDHLINFHIPYMEELKKENEVYTMAKDCEVSFADFNLNFEKKVLSCKNFRNVKKIKKILEENEFDIVVCNTTLASFFVRLAVKKLQKKPYVVNIVHGYLFGKNTKCLYKKALLSAEKMVKKVTNKIIVMNDEDYDIATINNLSNGEVVKIDGMGIDGTRFDKKANAKDNNCKEITFSFVGELSTRKNQKFLIEFIKNLEKFDIDAKLNLIGEGSLKPKLEKLIKKLKLQDKVFLLGYDKNIQNYFNASNYYICASTIEGLPFNILEAMFAGAVVFSSDAKGNVDLVDDLESGVLFETNNMSDLISKFRLVKNNLTLQEKLRENAKKTAQKYLISNVFDANMDIFKGIIKELDNGKGE